LRIFVISLVVANLLLLGFQSSRSPVQPETKAAPVTVRDSGIPTIHLFNEMVEDQGLLSGNRQCYTLGPFHSSEDRDDVHQRLLQVSTRISERRTEALVEKGYGVFMPPYASLLEANEALLSLQALGLNDIEIIYDGEWKNAIALGYFMRQENAQRRKQGLESKGYQPILRVQRQAEPRYWLDYEQNPGSGLLALDLQNRPNDFMQRPVPCPETGFPEAETVATQDPGLMPTEPQAPGEERGAVAVQGEVPDDSSIIGETPAEQVESVPEKVTGESSAEVEVSPKQAVGTGPEPTVSSEPVPLKDDTTDQSDPQTTENDDGTGEGR
jgi:hypothetical protein